LKIESLNLTNSGNFHSKYLKYKRVTTSSPI